MLTLADLLDKLTDFRAFAGPLAAATAVVVEETPGRQRQLAEGVYIDGTVDADGGQVFSIVLRLYPLPSPPA